MLVGKQQLGEVVPVLSGQVWWVRGLGRDGIPGWRRGDRLAFTVVPCSERPGPCGWTEPVCGK